VVITNTTGAAVSNLIFQDPAVTDLTVNSLGCSASSGASCPASYPLATMQAGGILLPTMDPGSSLTFTIGATVNTEASAGTLTNTASVTFRGETNSASDTNNVITKFNVAKAFTPESISAGDTSVMSITLQNTNLSAATNIIFNDVYPPGLVNTGAPGTTNSCGGTATATPGGNSLALNNGTLAAGATCTVTANVTTAVSGAYTNSTGTISSDQYSGDAAFATLATGVSSLQTATKTWQDLNGGEADPGDIIRYTITLTETAGVTATGVSVLDTLPVTLSGATVTSCPAGATCNVAGQTLTATNITIPANGSVAIVFDATIPLGTAAATAINNCADISNPTGIGASPCASTITVSPSAVAKTGNKPLYLDSGTTLSRTQASVTPAAVTISSGASQLWALSPALVMPVTISPTVTPLAILPANLYLSSDVANSSRTVQVTVACSGGGTTYFQSMTFDGTALNNPYLSTTPSLVLFNNLPFSADQTCAAGQSWDLTVSNNSGSGNVLVSPVSGGNSSYISLPSLSVINVDSVDNYNAAYPAITTPVGGNYTPGQTVYVRTVISDPFGSHDITSAVINITDPNGTLMVSAATMTEIVSLRTAATKTYEYAYFVPAFPANGNWSVNVTANEGSEGTVTDDHISAFSVVTPPNLTMVKSANGTTDADPGDVISYTLTITNSGSGLAFNVVVTDAMSPYTALALDPYGNGTPFTLGGDSGLSFQSIDYADGTDGGGNPTFGYTPISGGGGAPSGYDGNITHWQTTMDPTDSVDAAKQFTLDYQAIVK
jgi:uncharacterized repeat protein (TIGR01451 family)